MTNSQTTSHEGWLLRGSLRAPGLAEAISKIFQAPLEQYINSTFVITAHDYINIFSTFF